ncbi:MAG: aldose 1-epimerase family protein [Butyrivibrio sp.]|nr:aldose 1-epimerase family protein [Butyrivibrio sp.]
MTSKQTEFILTDGNTAVTVNAKGAELSSVVRDGVEYMWNANPEYWGRTAPVLFPIVGSLKDKRYRHKGAVYMMGQHGFARDMEFELVSKGDTKITMALTDNEDTQRAYPFPFRLEISYELDGKGLTVEWKVINTGKDEMYFSIGGHPAFMCPVNGEGRQSDYTIRLYKDGKPIEGFDCTRLTAEGTAAADRVRYETGGGILALGRELFLKDALILENSQADRVSLAKPDGTEYVTVEFDAPLVGLWSPAGKDAPFVCIEPWYGRCDGEDFDGELKEREWGNTLAAGAEFCRSCRIFFG